MLSPVITEPQGAAAALNWLVKEMENRYEFLKITGVRNIDSFNKRVINEELEGGKEIPRFLPFIVGIIDELADLMMVASSDIETPIARIAQMARAVGIHLILATQRPSREVITGLIKANFPTRISFKVASRINSQIILDETGAEALLGNGDMLFLPPGSSHLIRAQGAYIRDEDIQAVINFICDQAPPNYVIQSFDRMGEGLAISSENVDLDTLFGQAKEVVLSTGNASTTFLQRKLKIGYARAASLMDQLEMQGVVGPQEGSKPRRVFGPRIEESDTDEYIASLEEDMIE
jgi:S-DNA-T family DNA segregation ATPase FtsK/SpoIIIE